MFAFTFMPLGNRQAAVAGAAALGASAGSPDEFEPFGRKGDGRGLEVPPLAETTPAAEEEAAARKPRRRFDVAA
jgi:hypothetical protein